MCVTLGSPRVTHALEKGGHMLVFLYLEASQPSGATYRIGLGCFVPPKLASMVVLLIRLF
jgi:hypothetical protein